MTGNISAKADKAAAKKPKKVSKYSKRKVDPAFYWMTIPAMILVCIFLYLPFLQGAMYSFTNSQGYGDYKFIGFKTTSRCSRTHASATRICSRFSSRF